MCIFTAVSMSEKPSALRKKLHIIFSSIRGNTGAKPKNCVSTNKSINQGMDKVVFVCALPDVFHRQLLI